MRILLTGKDGQVGHELLRALAPLGDVIATSRAELDLTDLDRIRDHVRELEPDWIVNAAAYTAVDKAESEEALAMRINGEAPGVLAEEAKRLGAGLIHFSTDYVFSGEKKEAYVETDPTGPINAYGRSKLEGERRIGNVGGRAFVFRTSWVYAPHGKNFLLTILKLANEKPRLRVVADQIGAPTSAATIARAIGAVLSRREVGQAGLYHLTASGAASWHAFAQAIVSAGAARGLCRDVPVDAIRASEYQTPTRRPGNSTLSTNKAARELGLTLAQWQVGLAECLDALAAARSAAA